jgi:hypothetical protein
VQAVVFQGQRSYMAFALSKFMQWGVKLDMIVVEDDVTSIYVQAAPAAIKALHSALGDDGCSDYMGMH